MCVALLAANLRNRSCRDTANSKQQTANCKQQSKSSQRLERQASRSVCARVCPCVCPSVRLCVRLRAAADRRARCRLAGERCALRLRPKLFRGFTGLAGAAQQLSQQQFWPLSRRVARLRPVLASCRRSADRRSHANRRACRRSHWRPISLRPLVKRPDKRADVSMSRCLGRLERLESPNRKRIRSARAAGSIGPKAQREWAALMFALAAELVARCVFVCLCV